MPAKTKKTAAKKPKKYYIASNLLCSNNIFDHVKEICEKERSSYRCSAPSEVLSKKDLKGSREVVKNMRKIISVSGDGEVGEKEIEVTSWDRLGWRYFITPETLEDLENFADEIGFEAGINIVNPEEFEDGSSEEAWVEVNIGIPVPEEPFVILQLNDAFLEDEMCDCPECRADRGEPGEDEDE